MEDAAGRCASSHVLATGEAHSVRDFVQMAGQYLDMNIEFEGEEDQVGIDTVTET